MKFSHNGKYLATAGQDSLVFVWEVAPHRGEKAAAAEGEAAAAEQQRNGHQPGEAH